MTVAEIVTIAGLVLALVAWIAFAEHPTKQNLAVAVRRTLPYL